MQSGESTFAALAPVGKYEYRTARNRTILSLSGPHTIGDVVFFPNPDWEMHPLASVLSKRQDTPNDDCTGTTAQLEAVKALPIEELGTYDVIVEVL